MAKVTSKLQVTVPKTLAEAYHIEPGDEIEWVGEVGAIRLVPRARRPVLDTKVRVQLFDQATARQKARQATTAQKPSGDRGWSREELYDRGGTR